MEEREEKKVGAIQLEKLSADNDTERTTPEIVADFNDVVDSVRDENTHIIQPPRKGTTFFYTQSINLEDFSRVRQGTATNRLTKLTSKESNITRLDQITDVATIVDKDFLVDIANYATNNRELRVSCYQLLDAITKKFTETGAKSPKVILSLSDYMQLRGLKNRKEVRQQVIADLEILRGLSLTWTEPIRGKAEKFIFINLADSGSLDRDTITFTFGQSFFEALLRYPYMDYPNTLFRINSHKNPNSFMMLRKIAEHKRMNENKTNENLISVETLLSCCSAIPSYEQVNNSDRHPYERIIKPFERDLNALNETITWSYCTRGHVPIAEKTITDYFAFIELLIFVEWKNYPDQAQRLEHKAESKKSTSGRKKIEKKGGYPPA